MSTERNPNQDAARTIECLMMTDRGGRITSWNGVEIDSRALQRISRFQMEPVFIQEILEDIQEGSGCLFETARQDASVRRFFDMLTVAGLPLLVDFWIQFLNDRVIVGIRDASRAEDLMLHYRTLFDDMRHRMGNYAMVIMSQLEDLRDGVAVEDVMRRVESLQRAQRLVFDVKQVLVCDFVHMIRQTFDGFDVKIVSHHQPDENLAPEPFRALNVILTELSTNSIKHGALGQKGVVELVMGTCDGCLEIDWHEQTRGKASALKQEMSGLGLEIMQRIARSVRGTFTPIFENGDFTARVAVPLTR